MLWRQHKFRSPVIYVTWGRVENKRDMSTVEVPKKYKHINKKKMSSILNIKNLQVWRSIFYIGDHVERESTELRITKKN